MVGTIVSVAMSIKTENMDALITSVIIGTAAFLVVVFVISGYGLDIVKSGINMNHQGPKIDFAGQFIKGLKLFAVNIVYYLIPVIIGVILAVIFQHWVSGLITIILSVIFSLAAIMAKCRLAKSEDIMDALSVGQAIGDISRVGIVKVILLIIVFIVLLLISFSIAALLVHGFSTLDGMVGNHVVGVGMLGNYVVGAVMGIIGVYLVFFIGRATGLLYSDV